MSTLEEAANAVAMCAHLRVEFTPVKYPDGSFAECWRCAGCSVEFVRAVAHLPLRAEIVQLKLDFARDQAELASMRIAVAEAKADRDQAAKVTEELVDGLSEEARRRQAAEVEAGRFRELVAQFEAGLTRGAALPAHVLIQQARAALANTSEPAPNWLQKALRAVENAECSAQLEIKDRELRRSLVRNIIATFAPGRPLPAEEDLDG